MTAKSTNYTALLASKKGAAKASTGAKTRAEDASNEDLQQLNFKVPGSLKKEFKLFAATHDITMTELLQRSFEAYKAANN